MMLRDICVGHYGRKIGSLVFSRSLLRSSCGITYRIASGDDIPLIRSCNHLCLEEKYTDSYIGMHLALWPELGFVAEMNNSSGNERNGCVVGYVLGKVLHRTVAAMGERYYRAPPLLLNDAQSRADARNRFDKHQAQQLMASSPHDTQLNSLMACDHIAFITSVAIYPESRGAGKLKYYSCCRGVCC